MNTDHFAREGNPAYIVRIAKVINSVGRWPLMLAVMLVGACAEAPRPYQPFVDAAQAARAQRDKICNEALEQVVQPCANAIKAQLQCPNGQACSTKTPPACTGTGHPACIIALVKYAQKTDDYDYWQSTCWQDIYQTDAACSAAQSRLKEANAAGQQAIEQTIQQDRQDQQDRLREFEDFQANLAAQQARHQSYIAQPFGNSTIIRPWP